MQLVTYKCPNCSASISVHHQVQSYTCDYCGTQLIAQPTSKTRKPQAPVIVDNGKRDDLYLDALMIAVDMGRASTSVLQRRLSIGYGRAAEILDQLYMDGLIGEPEGAKPRKVLSKAYAVYEKVMQEME